MFVCVGVFLCVGSYAVGSYWLYHAMESTEKFVALIKVKTKSPEPVPQHVPQPLF